jgi:maltooligosyltrehalose trehalohydrolase
VAVSAQVWQRPFGAVSLGAGRAEFRVWAPAGEPTLLLRDEEHALSNAGDGVWEAQVEAAEGDDYRYRLNGREWPDPASRFQPAGIRGPSRVVDTGRFSIAPGPELELEELTIYELHVGTFSPEVTFDGVTPRLRALRELGVTAIELMPVATFPGNRGWGYDGVYAYAPHPAYGGPEGLGRLVDAAHREGLAVLLDVVYNHIGPGAEAIGSFGPYFTARHHTFWGDAIDYSQRGVREWAIGNAELWIRDYRVDGLRLDAVHAVYDDSPTHVLKELRDRVKALSENAFVISEMGPDDFRPLDEWDHDAMWLDSLHHELHVLLTGEREGYYEPFGSMDGLLRELRRPHPERLVVAAQNHDQIGNRAVGDRLPPGAHRVALAVVLFSTATPLLFMGEEYDESRPFQFFTDHIDPFIADATREGRKREFAKFSAFSGEELPDPQAVETFERSKLDPHEPEPLYRELLRLRRELPRELEATAESRVLTLRRGSATLVADMDNKTVELTA